MPTCARVLHGVHTSAVREDPPDDRRVPAQGRPAIARMPMAQPRMLAVPTAAEQPRAEDAERIVAPAHNFA